MLHNILYIHMINIYIYIHITTISRVIVIWSFLLVMYPSNPTHLDKEWRSSWGMCFWIASQGRSSPNGIILNITSGWWIIMNDPYTQNYAPSNMNQNPKTWPSDAKKYTRLGVITLVCVLVKMWFSVFFHCPFFKHILRICSEWMSNQHGHLPSSPPVNFSIVHTCS